MSGRGLGGGATSLPTREVDHVVHDLGNLVQIIALASRRAVSAPPESGQWEQAMCAIEQSATLARELCSSFREAGSGARGRSMTDVNQVLLRLIPMLTSSASSAHPGVRLVPEIPAEPARVAISASDLTRVVLNLVVNAAEAADGHGTIMLRTDVRGSALRVLVADDGRGMSRSVLRRARLRGFSTKRAQSSRGVGLTSATQLVSAVGGTLDVESVLGVGTQVSVWLPLDPPKREAPLPERTSVTRALQDYISGCPD